MFLTSDDTSLSFVCDENFGSGTFRDSTQVSPSLISSPKRKIYFFLKTLSFAYLLITRVKSASKPNKCVPLVLLINIISKSIPQNKLNSTVMNIQFLHYLFFHQYKLVLE